MFKTLNDMTAEFEVCKSNKVLFKLINSSLAGALAAFFSNPMDMALVRIQGDGVAVGDKKKGYTNVAQTMAKIYYQEGLPAWFNGVGPSMIRAIL